ncbi:MAG TPA: hypothetical protein DHV57_05495 [Hyphomonas sp.]|nr:hypothetical protein [Hyphomonas sp.]HCJ16858.1 hypothetical protein [Hyphomonas sp.]|tara:strand:+ start:260 stop:529 length:270 start_codon:yes stop_codon:yes gene_type:complete
MLKIELSKMDCEFADEVIHRLGVLQPDIDISLVGGDLQVTLAAGEDAKALSQLIHDQFLQCRLAGVTCAISMFPTDRLNYLDPASEQFG